MIYMLLIMGVVTIAAGGFAKIEHSGKLEAEAKVETLETKIQAQNDAIKATKDEGDRRVAAASRGIAKATTETQAARTEAERLRKLAGDPGKPSACPSGDAVAQVRSGL